ncbi:MAG: single-stranded DNA-binding protein [Campylobacterota bacterium]|nr:single-stranded DNA-binding protein [Campylobacterota bacterium]
MYNKVIMIGNLTRDIELKYLPSGSAIAKGAIATSHKYKMQDGTSKEEVCFLDFTVFGKGGEILNQYVRKGSKVMLEGRLIFEQWQDQNGQNRNRHTLRVEEFKFLDSKADSMGGGNNYNAPQQASQQQDNSGYGQNNNNSYQAAQPQYNQQNSYNQQSQQQQTQGGANAQASNSYEQNIPTIDIDNDEIPF